LVRGLVVFFLARLICKDGEGRIGLEENSSSSNKHYYYHRGGGGGGGGGGFIRIQ
jgi:hypothetical protein